ncbi:MAG: MBL fold metallo-hydrolase [Pseudomonadota bacterium]
MAIEAPLSRLAPLMLFAVALAACDAGAGGPAESVARPDDGRAGTATSILNAGIVTEMGGGQQGFVKFLFDPLYDEHYGTLEVLTPEMIEAIVSGAPPYDGVAAVFITHAHGDHLSEKHTIRLMEAQPDVLLIAPEQVFEALRKEPGWRESFEERSTSIALTNGKASAPFVIAGATVEAFQSPHNGWPERHTHIDNLTFRVAFPAGEGRTARIMHMGDADPDPQHFAELEGFLKASRTGLAVVPFWQYREEEFDALLDVTFNAQKAVAVHVPAKTPAFLEEGSRPYFSEAGEEQAIPSVEE